MQQLDCTNEQIKTAFANGLMNGYAKYKGIEGVCFDDALVPLDIQNKLSSDILSEEFVHVEVVGWLYQYFVDADREQAVDVIGGADIEGALVTAATQVFTPSWIVKYLVDNSLGKYFAAMFGEKAAKEHLAYYIPDGKLPTCETKLWEITFFDPCCGSGNILVYAFEVYMKMYTMLGFSKKKATRLIIEQNIFGADIDETAANLASFSLMIKAAEHDKDIFLSLIRPNIYHACDKGAIGSLAMHSDKSHILGKSYNVVCTNPPYLGRVGGTLKEYLTSTMKPYSKDLFTAFIYRGFLYCKKGGYLAYLTPNVWMYLSSHKSVRDLILDQKHLTSLVQLEKGSFFSEASVDLCAFTVKNEYCIDKAVYIRADGISTMQGQMSSVAQEIERLRNGFLSDCVYRRSADYFDAFPDRVMAFFATEDISKLFEKAKIGDVYAVKQGMTTGNNKMFVKYWWEVPLCDIGFGMADTLEAKKSGKKWFPYNKGGKYRKWYGNNYHIVMYENDGAQMKEYTSRLPQGTWVRLKSREYYFKSSLTWSFISSSHFGVRYSPQGAIFDVAGSSLFGDDLMYVLGFLCTKTAFYLLQLINPTMNYQIRDVKLLPYIVDDAAKDEVVSIVQECISLAKKDWDSSELSYDFDKDPLVKISDTSQPIDEAIKKYIFSKTADFERMKTLESRLNSVFADVYSVNGIIDTSVSDKDITVKIPTENTCAQNLMSYIAGCCFGRYSPLKDGVISTHGAQRSVGSISEYAHEFIGRYFGADSEEYIKELLGCDIDTYYRKKFCKNHFAMYHKRPLYTQKGDMIIYFNAKK